MTHSYVVSCMLCEGDHSGERDDGRFIVSTLNPFES